MSAGTSGILPSGVYAAYDGSTRLPSNVSADPLWLSTNGGQISGNVGIAGNLAVTGNASVSGSSTLTGAVALPGGISSMLFVPEAIGDSGYITFGAIRFAWETQTIDATNAANLQIPPFAFFLFGNGTLPSAVNLLCQVDTRNPATGVIRFVTVNADAPHAPGGAGSTIFLFAVVALDLTNPLSFPPGRETTYYPGLPAPPA